MSSLEINELQFEPSSILTVIGATKCGKSSTVADILINAETCFKKVPTKWVIVYEFWDKSYDALRKKLDVQFVKGWRENILDELKLCDRQQEEWQQIGLLIDDCAEQLAKSKTAAQLFSGGIHHHSLFLIFITQHHFIYSNIYRLCMCQSQYILMFYSPRQAIKMMSQQIFSKPNFLPTVLDSVGAYNAILLDLQPTTKKELQCRHT